MTIRKKNEVLRVSAELLDKYAISEITPSAIKNLLGAEGYTVIRYSALSLSEETARLMKHLQVTEVALREYSFTYRTREHRIVFIRKEVSDDEFLYLLLTELGRVLFVQNGEALVRGTPLEEEKAAEFAYRLGQIRRKGLFYSYFTFYPIGSFLLSGIAALALITLIFKSMILPSLLTETPLYADGEKTESTETINSAVTSTVPGTSDTSSISSPSGALNLSDTSNASDTSGASDTSVDSRPSDEAVTAFAPAQTDGVTTQTPDPSASEASSNASSTASGITYYATADGKKYHKAGCSYIKGKNVIELTEAEAQSKYSPCSRCFK